MKNLKFLLFILLGLLAVSCGDDACESTDINEIILGTWSYNGFDITFNADGSMDDPSNLFEGEINNVILDEDRYTLNGDSILTIETFSSSPPAEISIDYKIDSYNCEEMVLTSFVTVTMEKK